MTVIVGILCQDGVVLGSDSSATFGDGHGRPTIEQPCKKTIAVGNTILFAGTGRIGLHQRFEAVLHNLKCDPRKVTSQIELGKQISREAIADFASTQAPNEFGALVAHVGPHKTFGLIEFDTGRFQPEFKHKDMWFVAMGSGQGIVDPFFALMRKSLFRDAQPRLREGIFTAVWALEHAIELNTGGINGPIQLGTIGLDSTEKFLEARLLTPDELDEHQQAVEDMTKYVADYRNQLSGKVQIDATPPPAPPTDNPKSTN